MRSLAEHEETEEFQKSALCGEGMLKVQSDLCNPVDARVEMDDEKDGQQQLGCLENGGAKDEH